MADVLVFHHALGQTAGFHAFAAELRRAGHTVHTPNLYDGLSFPSIHERMAHVEEIGFHEIGWALAVPSSVTPASLSRSSERGQPACRCRFLRTR